MEDSRSTFYKAVLVACILGTALALVGYGTPAVAQQTQGQQTVAEAQPQAQPQAEQPVAKGQKAITEEVTVTGSLIPRPTLEAMAPVTTLDVEAVQFSGINRLEDFLVNLPQIFVAQNTSISNGATGTATVDLRDMGDVRTLVLLDGRRLPAGDTSDVGPDLNFIPDGLIKRVDILTGGASATYGADAVAGVVNFIIDKDFVGFKGGVSGGGYEHNNDNKTAEKINADAGYTVPKGQAWDGGSFEAFAAYGDKFADNKGHSMVYVDYRKTAGLFKNRRDYYNCDVSGYPPDLSCGGSSNSYPGAFYVYGPPDAEGNQDYFGKYTIDQTTGNTMRRFTSTDYYNYNPWNSMQRPDIRWGAGAFIDYDWNQHAHGYIEAMFMDDRTFAVIAPTADFLGSAGSLWVNCDNPELSAQEVNTLCTQAGYGPHDLANILIGRRNVEGGGRTDDFRHQAYRLVAGVKGEITKGWTYDVYGLQAMTKASDYFTNEFNAQRVQEALLVTGDPNDPSTWKCSSGNPECVPWNIFKIGGVTQAALNYLALPEVAISDLTTQVLSGKVNADLKTYGWQFPSAAEGIQIALGAEYRKEFLNYQPDFAYQNNLGAGAGGAREPVNGFYDVQEGFFEAQIPIVQGARGAQDLSLNVGYRYSDYNLSGGHSTYKFEGAWAPSTSLKFRAGYNRATRAPNASELFQPQALDLQGSVDPCTNNPVTGVPDATLEQCERSGVRASQYGHLQQSSASQYNNLYGGNTSLEPEIADTNTFGIVITPSALSGFTAALDYYDIKVKDTIGALTFDSILNQCLKTGAPSLCNLIHRDQYGSLWQTGNGYIITTNQNVGKIERKGVDVNLTYIIPAGNSLFNFNLIGSYYNKVWVDNGVYQYDCVGLYGNQCGSPAPSWRHLFRVSWETGNLTLTAAWRMIGSVKIDYASTQEALTEPDFVQAYKDVGAYRLAAYNYVDLAANYKLAPGIRWTLGINNIADREPPTGFGYGDNGYAAGMYGTYDYAGRFIHSAVTFNF
jgi:iron complex outermembrane receptor protein